ncbi:MAG TPA: hypothetical protein VN421_01155 [Pseudoflavonifractor sp.]|nr:hypothetical protein [Pseudoflavonifractor sp.]
MEFWNAPRGRAILVGLLGALISYVAIHWSSIWMLHLAENFPLSAAFLLSAVIGVLTGIAAYFQARIHALEARLDELEERVETLRNRK